MLVALRAIAAFFARRDVPVSAASLGRDGAAAAPAALGTLPLSPCEIGVDAMYVRLWDQELSRGWTSNTACVLLAINHDPRLNEKSRYIGRREYLHHTGHPTYRLIRYANDFVLIVKGTANRRRCSRRR